MTMKALTLALLLGMAMTPSAAAHDHHKASVGALTVVHPWARAVAAGGDTLVFFELSNAGAADRLLGAHTEAAAAVEIVGITHADGGTGHQPVGAVDIAPGDFAFDPHGLALLLRGVSGELAPGAEFELELEFETGGHLDLYVEVEAADATQHSHAGHSH